MSKRLLDYDTFTGIKEWYVPDGDKFHIMYEQDVEPILEGNKAKQSMGRAYYARDPDMWKVASIPITVQMEWLKKYGIKDVCAEEYWPKVQKLLNSNEYRYLKTADIIV